MNDTPERELVILEAISREIRDVFATRTTKSEGVAVDVGVAGDEAEALVQPVRRLSTRT